MDARDPLMARAPQDEVGVGERFTARLGEQSTNTIQSKQLRRPVAARGARAIRCVFPCLRTDLPQRCATNHLAAWDQGIGLLQVPLWRHNSCPSSLTNGSLPTLSSTTL